MFFVAIYWSTLTLQEKGFRLKIYLFTDLKLKVPINSMQQRFLSSTIRTQKKMTRASAYFSIENKTDEVQIK